MWLQFCECKRPDLFRHTLRYSCKGPDSGSCKRECHERIKKSLSKIQYHVFYVCRRQWHLQYQSCPRHAGRCFLWYCDTYQKRYLLRRFIQWIFWYHDWICFPIMGFYFWFRNCSRCRCNCLCAQSRKLQKYQCIW